MNNVNNDKIYTAIQKSTNGSKIERTQKKTIVSKRVVLSAILGFMSTFGLIKGAEGMFQSIQMQSIVSEENKTASDIMKNNTHRTNDRENFWYDTEGIAKDTIKSYSEDLYDVALYGYYSDIRFNRQSNMDNIIRDLSHAVPDNSRFKNYSDFDDYLIKNNFVDDKGNIDKKIYEDKMKKYIVSLNNLNENDIHGGKSI